MTYLFSFILSVSFAGVSGTHLQNFNANIDGKNFVTVESAESLEQGQFNFQFFSHFSMNSLLLFRTPSTTGVNEPDNELLFADFALAYGLTDKWTMGMALPLLLSQSVDNPGTIGFFDEKGLTELRLYSKYRFFEREDWMMALSASVNFDRIEDNPFSGQDPGPTININYIYQRTLQSNLLFALNFGYRLADEGRAIVGSGVTPIGDQLYYSVALRHDLDHFDFDLIGEIFGSSPLGSVDLPTDTEPSNLEVLFGITQEVLMEGLQGHAGIGAEVYDGLASPDFRLYAGLNWTFSPDPVEKTMPEPEPYVAPEKPDQSITLNDIQFSTGEAQLSPASQQIVLQTARQIQAKGVNISRLVVEGHTDDVGSSSSNQALSFRRARSVTELLQQELSLAPGVISPVGYGEDRPVSSNSTKEGRKKNRRVEIRIYRSPQP